MWVFLFLLGLVFGSFLNVLILRYDPEKEYSLKTAGGRSRCLHCGKQLAWYELIPVVSYILQGAKCRSCRKTISLQYPIVELACAAAFVFVPRLIQSYVFQMALDPNIWGIVLFSAVWIIAICFLIAAFFIDFRHYVIPNPLNVAIFASGLAWTVIGYAFSFGGAISKGSLLGSFGDLFYFTDSFAWNHVIGAAIGIGFFLLIVLISRGKGMGMGDVKLIGGLGMLFGYPDIALIIALSFVVGSLYAIPLLMFRKKSMADRIPFGPFIVLASLLIFFFGPMLLGEYFDIIQKIGNPLV